MSSQSRRRFLSDVGSGMLVAGVGASMATELGIAPAWAEEDEQSLTFGELEPLVDLMHQTPLEKLQPTLVAYMKEGTKLKTLITAGSLANARRFAGHDYVGFHTMMALMPAWQIAEELPQSQQALPVLKVLYRNTARMHEAGGKARMSHVEPARNVDVQNGGQQLFEKMLSRDYHAAESTFLGLLEHDRKSAFSDLQHMVQDNPNVHRVTLSWRAWDAMQLVGEKHANTLLRQSVRFCVERERGRMDRNQPEPPLRALMPRLLEEYKLLGKLPAQRKADAAWLEKMARTFFSSDRDESAEAAAAALAEGFAAEDVAEAMSLAANMLVLHDPGRREENSNPKLPKDSVHGASVGVHASDAANAWRNISRVTNPRNRVCSLIAGAWHVAGQTKWVGEAPFDFDVDAIAARDLGPYDLLEELKAAVETKDQPAAMAVVRHWEMKGHRPKAIFNSLRAYAVSQDGALHAEKYFRTVTEEFGSSRPEFRWRHLIGLARVTASEFGWPAPGREQALDLLSS